MEPQVKGVQVWIASQNAKGGINCHPIRYIVRDDGGDPSRHQAAVRQLVEQDRILAFLHMIAALTGQTSVDYITEQRIPVVGNDSSGYWYYTSPMYFPQMSLADGVIRGGFGAAGMVAKAEGKSKLANLACVEVPACSNANDLASRYAAENGLVLVYQGRYSLVQPDFTANCQAAKDADAEILGFWGDGNSLMRMARSCRGINYRPLLFGPMQAMVEGLPSNPDVDGMVFVSTVIPWYETDNAAVVEYQNALKRHGAGVQPDSNTSTGWVSSKLFELAIHGLNGRPTSSTILEGLWSIKDNDLGGLTAPLTFTRDQPPPQVTCYWVVQLKDGQFATHNNGERICRDE